MLDETAIAQINVNLDLCDTYLLNTSEINYLNAIGENPLVTCEYWSTTQKTLNARAETDSTINQSLEMLIALSNLDSCDLALTPELVPEVNIPFFAGAIR